MDAPPANLLACHLGRSQAPCRMVTAQVSGRPACPMTIRWPRHMGSSLQTKPVHTRPTVMQVTPSLTNGCDVSS